jgi:quinol---cytochrome c reductase iron-sulfur subunit, bacillus type
MESRDQPNQPARRDFVKKSCALIVGAITALVPSVSGVFVLLDPLRRRRAGAEAVRVASLNALPADGKPRRFPVVADRVDAWNRTPHVPIGAVYLRRLDDTKVEALNVVCPHAGCFVDYVAAENGYHCPCHDSRFALDGRISDPKSPSPRPMDELPVEIRNRTEIWVRFENFRAGQREKIPV